jgi:preprotein translocase subunit YajC
MLRRFGVGLVGAIVLTGSLLTMAAAQDAKKDSGTAKSSGKGTAAADTKEIKGKVTKVDADKGTFSIETDDGKKLDFKVDDKVKFVGPRGGPSKQGIKDDRFKVGAQVTLTTDASGKVLQQVKLPVRTKGKPDKSKTGKDTTKDK